MLISKLINGEQVNRNLNISPSAWAGYIRGMSIASAFPHLTKEEHAFIEGRKDIDDSTVYKSILSPETKEELTPGCLSCDGMLKFVGCINTKSSGLLSYYQCRSCKDKFVSVEGAPVELAGR